MSNSDLMAQYNCWLADRKANGVDMSGITFADWCRYIKGSQATQEELLYGPVIGLKDESRAEYITSPQPAPVNKDGMPASWDLVVSDMQERKDFGIKKYGVPLKPHNGRDTLVDAYQEALDLVVYLRTLLYERDGK